MINFLVFSAVYEDEISSLFRITSKSNIAEEVGSASWTLRKDFFFSIVKLFLSFESNKIELYFFLLEITLQLRHFFSRSTPCAT